MKKILAIFVLMFALLLSSCGLGSLTSTSKEAANCFFEYVSNGNYTEAEAMLDDSAAVEKGDLKKLFDNIKQKTGADISNGFSIKFTGFNSSTYDSNYNGACCSLSGVIEIDGVKFDLELLFVERSDILKLNNLHLNPKEETIIGNAI